MKRIPGIDQTNRPPVTAPTAKLSERYRMELAQKHDKANYDCVQASLSLIDIKPHAADYNTHEDWKRALREHSDRMRRLQSVADELVILACLIDG